MSETVEELQLKLAEARVAYHKLMTGTQSQSVSMASQYNNRSQTFTQASVDELRRYINDLESQIAVLQGSTTNIRRPVRFNF